MLKIRERTYAEMYFAKYSGSSHTMHNELSESELYCVKWLHTPSQFHRLLASSVVEIPHHRRKLSGNERPSRAASSDECISLRIPWAIPRFRAKPAHFSFGSFTTRSSGGNYAECSTELTPMIEFLAQGSTKNTWSASK